MTSERPMEQGQGTIICGADGALYFIRDEIMQACRVTEPEYLQACEEVLSSQADVSGYNFSPSLTFSPSSSTGTGPHRMPLTRKTSLAYG